ncbi:CidA/LrgA family protein [Dendrosporobacter sp. 1207_IL3150]|uniref:CidA/LrgA family protein n=1 Tax=Dendrosporobacter sp. 1207_IL3150 TaxID=3084054 RepID=UPI002FD8FEF0
MLKIVKFILQTAFLWIIYWSGNQITQMFSLPIPGNVVGMILLFALLMVGIVRIEHVEIASSNLLKHMSFFFIPLAVGLMNWGDLFLQHSLVLTLAVIVSAVITFLTVGYIVQIANRSN